MICWYFDFMYLTCVTAKIHLRSTVSLMNRAWPWRMSNLVKYCQALCLFWSLIFDLWKNGHRLTLKSLFTCHHHPPPTTRNLFLVSNERYGQNRLFYSGATALILPWLKDIAHFVFMIVHKEFLPLWSLTTLSVLLSSLLLSVCLMYEIYKN